MSTTGDNTSAMATELAETLRDRCIAFIGAGSSMAPPSCIPGWRACFLELAAVAEKYGHTAVGKRTKKVAKASDYAPRYLATAFEELREAIGERIYVQEIEKLLTPKAAGVPKVLEYLARLPFVGYITTNLDRLIEDAGNEAYRAVARARPLQASPDPVVVRREFNRQSDGWLWKMHGSIELPSSWVFTASEYWSAIFSQQSEKHRELFRDLESFARLVFFGFSGGDPDVSVYLDEIISIVGGQQRRHVLYTDHMPAASRRVLANRNIAVVEYGVSPNHETLLRLLEQTLLALRQPAIAPVDAKHVLRDHVRACTQHLDVKRMLGSQWLHWDVDRLDVNVLYVDLYESRASGAASAPIAGELPESNLCAAVIDDSAPSLLLVGPGGSGKSTLMKKAAQTLLGSAGPLAPLFVRCQDLREFIGKGSGDESDLETVVAAVLPVGQYSRQEWVTILRSSRFTWLIDGLDELSTLSQREKMLKMIERRLRVACDRIVVSSRPLDVLRQGPAELHIVHVGQLRDGEISQLVGRLVAAAGPEQDVSIQRAATGRILAAFQGESDLRELARSPLTLTALVLYQVLTRNTDGLRARAKATILGNVATWLLEGRKHTCDGRALEMGDLAAFYGALALEMQRRPAETERWWLDVLACRRCASTTLHVDGDAASEFVRQQVETGLLDDTGDGQIVFRLPDLQTYYCARALAARDIQGRAAWEVWSGARLWDGPMGDVVELLPACFLEEGPDQVLASLDALVRLAQAESISARSLLYARVGRGLVGILGHAYKPQASSPWSALCAEMLELYKSGGIAQLPLSARLQAADTVSRIEGSWLTWAMEWIDIPAGRVKRPAGTELSGSIVHALPWVVSQRADWSTSGFGIRRAPVTVTEYRQFVDDNGYHRRELWSETGWGVRTSKDISFPREWYRQMESPSTPVTDITWFEAEAFCTWLATRDSSATEVRLPNMEEWEYAAQRRGTTGRLASGSSWDLGSGEAATANWYGAGLLRKTPVGCFPASNTTDGVVDMMGNVEEWCLDSWSPECEAAARSLVATDRAKSEGLQKIVRGGSAIRVGSLCHPSYFSRCIADHGYPTIGFRPIRVMGGEGA